MKLCKFRNCNEYAVPPNDYCSRAHARLVFGRWSRVEHRGGKRNAVTAHDRGSGSCRKEGCDQSAATGQVYCSKEHAPLGTYGERRR